MQSYSSHLRHYHKITKKESSKGLKEESRALFEPISNLASERVKNEIFPKLRIDSVTSIVKNDRLIISYANFFADKYTNRDQDSMIRTELRLLGTLALQLNQDHPKVFPDLETAFVSDCFGPFINSLIKVAKVAEATELPEKGSRAERLVAVIRKAIDILKADLIMAGKKGRCTISRIPNAV